MSRVKGIKDKSILGHSAEHAGTRQRFSPGAVNGHHKFKRRLATRRNFIKSVERAAAVLASGIENSVGW